MEVTTLTLAVDSRQVRGAATDLDRMSRSGKDVETVSGKLQRSFGALKGVLAGVSASLVVRQIVQAADAYSSLNARLALATKSAQEFTNAQRALFNISQQTRVGLEQTTDLFSSLSRSTESLGASQEELLGVTETINQALLVSGTNAQSASAALVQLGQGFASGTLRGEELNSVLEQAPRLARAIADGLGVPLGKLRELGQAGELTAEKVFRALQKSSDKIADEFGRLPLTVGQATTQSENALLKLIGTIDKTAGATTSLAETISGAANFISDLADDIDALSKGSQDVGFLAQAFLVITQTVKILYANVKFVFQGIGREIAAVAAQLAALAQLDFDGFSAISDAVKEDAERARAELDAYERRIMSIGRIQLPDLGQTDRRELARRGRRVEGFGAPPAASDSPGKEKISEAARYLESLRKQLQSTRDLTVAETVLDDIRAGRLGKITAAQREQLLAVAQQIDAAKRAQEEERKRADLQKQLLEAEATAREKAYELQQRSLQTNLEEVQALIGGNEILRDEIALIGADAEARAKLEIARVDATIALKEETLAQLENSGATQAETDAIRQQIELLKQRKGLISEKGAAEQIAEDAKKSQELVKSLGLTFSSAFEDAIVNGRKFGDVLKGIEKDLIRLLARKLITEPIANGISGLFSGGGGGGGWIGTLMSFFGGRRAIGGPVSAGQMYRVNERGPELLNVAGQQYLMMGNQGGKVSPGGGGVTIVQNMQFGSNVDRAELSAWAEGVKRQTLAEVQRSATRGGALS